MHLRPVELRQAESRDTYSVAAERFLTSPHDNAAALSLPFEVALAHMVRLMGALRPGLVRQAWRSFNFAFLRHSFANVNEQFECCLASDRSPNSD